MTAGVHPLKRQPSLGGDHGWRTVTGNKSCGHRALCRPEDCHYLLILGKQESEMGFAAQDSAGGLYPTGRASLAPWLETKLSQRTENVHFFIIQRHQWCLREGDAAPLLSPHVPALAPRVCGAWLRVRSKLETWLRDQNRKTLLLMGKS